MDRSGMDCGSCANKNKTALERLPGVSDINVALMTERLKLSLDETQTRRDKVEATVKALGYGIKEWRVGRSRIAAGDRAGGGRQDRCRALPRPRTPCPFCAAR
ncbi:heavy-metal-associated domain-containing protein (plasmid) [Pseudorhodobacter turbinis]|uniref:Heavy-metal-associated domain-containing protein n=1 Tax=Pseudorhodobacter turbinis TaxID=2500533 RepID=A0A4P8EKJ8_9RHOB|nr:heavy-metal-associated domain-containing protein [Pseudorhodobacter turbinis]